MTDALGNLVRFRPMPGNPCDSVDVLPLIKSIVLDGLVAAKAFDSNALVAELNSHGALSTANFFCRLKELQRIVMRACKTAQGFESMIYLATGVINSR